MPPGMRVVLVRERWDSILVFRLGSRLLLRSDVQVFRRSFVVFHDNFVDLVKDVRSEFLLIVLFKPVLGADSLGDFVRLVVFVDSEGGGVPVSEVQRNGQNLHSPVFRVRLQVHMFSQILEWRLGGLQFVIFYKIYYIIGLHILFVLLVKML